MNATIIVTNKLIILKKQSSKPLFLTGDEYYANGFGSINEFNCGYSGAGSTATTRALLFLIHGDVMYNYLTIGLSDNKLLGQQHALLEKAVESWNKLSDTEDEKLQVEIDLTPFEKMPAPFFFKSFAY